MNSRVTLIMVLVFAVVAGATVFSTRNSASTAAGTPTPDTSVFTFPAAAVQTITVTSGGATVKVAQNAQQQWALVSPTATYTDGTRVTSVVASLAGLTKARDIAVGTNPLSDYGLDKPSTTATVTLSDGSSHTVLFGAQDPTGTGFYAQVQGQAGVFLAPLVAVQSIASLAATPPIATPTAVTTPLVTTTPDPNATPAPTPSPTP